MRIENRTDVIDIKGDSKKTKAGQKLRKRIEKEMFSKSNSGDGQEKWKSDKNDDKVDEKEEDGKSSSQSKKKKVYDFLEFRKKSKLNS